MPSGRIRGLKADAVAPAARAGRPCVCARDGHEASNPCPGFWQPPLEERGEKLKKPRACVGDGRGGQVGGPVGRVTSQMGWTSVSQGEATARPPLGVVQCALRPPRPWLWCPTGQPFCPRPAARRQWFCHTWGWMPFGDARVLCLSGRGRSLRCRLLHWSAGPRGGDGKGRPEGAAAVAAGRLSPSPPTSSRPALVLEPGSL